MEKAEYLVQRWDRDGYVGSWHNTRWGSDITNDQQAKERIDQIHSDTKNGNICRVLRLIYEPIEPTNAL